MGNRSRAVIASRRQGAVARPTAPEAAGEDTLSERIFQRAIELFADRGYAGTSVQALCEAAGVTKGAFYYYYSSKDELLYEVYHRLIAKELENLERIRAQADLPVPEQLHALVSDVLQQTAAHRSELVIFLREMHLLSAERIKAIRRDRRAYHVAFRGVIEDGQAKGVFRSDVSAEMLTIGFFGLVHHYYTWYGEDGPYAPDELADEAMDCLLAALLVRGGSRAAKNGRRSGASSRASSRRGAAQA